MKKNILTIIILLPIIVFGQKYSSEEYQKELFKKAELALKKSKGLEALHYYCNVYSIDLDKKLESLAKIKIDSLLPLFQKNEVKKWRGKWILKQLKTDRFSYDQIVITSNEILFYDKKNDSIPTRIEVIKSVDYNPNELEVPISKVVFKNKEIWEFYTKKVNNELRLYPNLKTDAKGLTYILLDERAMIKGKAEREKAMAEDIWTYYIHEK